VALAHHLASAAPPGLGKTTLAPNIIAREMDVSIKKIPAAGDGESGPSWPGPDSRHSKGRRLCYWDEDSRLQPARFEEYLYPAMED